MNEDTTCQDSNLKMTDECSIYRAARSAAWINLEERKLYPAAYKLRPAETSLSVCPSDSCTAAEYSAEDICHLRKVFGVAIHRVADTHALGLVVRQDEQFHAGICGLPLANDEIEQQYVFEAELARQSNLVWERPKQA